jgi:hypothetical protein
MKKILEDKVLTIAIIAFCSLFAFSVYHLYRTWPGGKEIINTSETEPDYDSMCIVGQEYTVCNRFDLNNEDPFQQGRGKHRVIITDKQQGYVQYAEVGSTVDIFYSRSCKEFIRLTEDCNK